VKPRVSANDCAAWNGGRLINAVTLHVIYDAL